MKKAFIDELGSGNKKAWFIISVPLITVGAILATGAEALRNIGETVRTQELSSEYDSFLDAHARQALSTNEPTELFGASHTITSFDSDKRTLAVLHFNAMDISSSKEVCAKYNASGSPDIPLSTDEQATQRSVCTPR